MAAAGFGATAMFRPNAIASLFKANIIAGERSPEEVAEDEAYWTEIQRAFDTDRTLINLNNGGVSPTPTHVLEAMIRDLKFTNESPAEHMWRVLEPRIESVRRDLAKEFGCDTEELAITRNASEANEIMILGLDLKPGDEVVVSNQNYGRMLTTWDQRVRRDGIVLKQISFKVPPPSQKYIFDQFVAAVTPRTKVIELPHITNLTGQIMPIRELVDFARPRGIEVLVDGAHSFGHFPFTRDDLGVDYFGTSLHKWLLAPVGTGFLYVKKEKIRKLWPLMAAAKTQDEDIRKYEEIGTHPAANHNAISAALIFNENIGIDRKAARMRYLRDRWAHRLQQNPKCKTLHSEDPAQSCGIGFLAFNGIDPGKIADSLYKNYNIITAHAKHEEYDGLRITPHIYSTLRDVDFFADAVEREVKNG